MNKYEIKIIKKENSISYLIESIFFNDLDLIKCIDNDKKINEILKYNHEKYEKLNCDCKYYLAKFVKSVNYSIKKSFDDISSCIVVFLLLIYHNEFIKRVTYQILKDNLYHLENFKIDISDLKIINWNQIEVKIKKNVEKYDHSKISMITFTTYEYINYTKNLIISLQMYNIIIPLKVYCIDEESYNELKQLNGNIVVIKYFDKDITKGIKEYLQDGWSKFVINKIKCIYSELFENGYVLYIDGDIIIKNDLLLDYLMNEIKDEEILFQKNKGDTLCCGFMFIRSTDNVKGLFNDKNIDMNDFICDEDYINKNKDKINYKCLRRENFPIERYYRKYLETIDPYIIHFNIETGLKKEKSIKELGYWYIK